MSVDRPMLETRSTTDTLQVRRIVEDVSLSSVQRMALVCEVVADYQRNLEAVPLWKALSARARSEARRIRANRDVLWLMSLPTDEPVN